MLVTWGSNPACVLAALLMQAGIDADEIDAAEVAALAEYCDEPVQSQGDLANPPS